MKNKLIRGHSKNQIRGVCFREGHGKQIDATAASIRFQTLFQTHRFFPDSKPTNPLHLADADEMSTQPELIPRVQDEAQLRKLLARLGIDENISLDDPTKISELIASSSAFSSFNGEFEDQKKERDSKLDDILPTLSRRLDDVWVVSSAEYGGMSTVTVMDGASGKIRNTATVDGGAPSSKHVVLALKRAMCFPESESKGQPCLPGSVYFAFRLQPVYGPVSKWLDSLGIDRELESREDAVGENPDPELEKEQDEARARTEVADLKSQGNDAYRKKDWIGAIDFYGRALRVLRDTKIFADQDTVAADKAIIFANRAAAYLKSPHRLNEALQDADKAIALNPDYGKGYVRKAMALKALKRDDEAIEFLVTRLNEAAVSDEAMDLIELLKELVPSGEDERLKDLHSAVKSFWKPEPADKE